MKTKIIGAKRSKTTSGRTKMELCKHHHVVLCDKLPDAVLDTLKIPASDFGDFQHVNEDRCAVCARKEEEVYCVNTAPGLWHVDMPGESEDTDETVKAFTRATNKIPACLVCGDLDWWYTNEQDAIAAAQIFEAEGFTVDVINELLSMNDIGSQR